MTANPHKPRYKSPDPKARRCNYCSERGHFEATCPVKAADKERGGREVKP